ncbi:MAG TPA: prephenate dehydrogenase [Actinophytocola sp.]|uniref:prephenate dehydrogenase n=1 Tax=Actinophytocola sp. TaxID=1872138 RepID=UPI002DBA0D91|nr:prephenate dehydrogenase [Actinophytocola sp.]HEU5470834.1 prephenate dehydrogenase [Actinophytocola sp.]
MTAVRPVCVIGLGLIGGSVLRAAGAAGREVWGATAAEADVEAARADGFTVESTVDEALVRAGAAGALVVVAVPLPAVDGVLRRVAELAPDCMLTDVVSVKAPVLAAVRRMLPRTRYAGGHPMAGAAVSGWPAGSATLFDGASWAVTVEPDTDLAVWREVAELALDGGARVVPATAAEHDAAVARISHLPHVLAAVLAATGADGGPLALTLAAGSFADGTRVAGSRAELVLAMCEGNLNPLLAAVDDALGRLGVARGALASTGSLRATVTSGNAGRAALQAHRTGERIPTKVDLTGPRVHEELAAVGRRGGWITGFQADMALAELPFPMATPGT